MKAYKGFNKDLTCRDYQFKEGIIHKTPEANCRANGFHCAEDPLDCLTYYSDWDDSVYYIVEAMGDINEDGDDSKISCTKILLKKRLTLEDFVFESLLYMAEHPMREWNNHVYSRQFAAKKGFGIVRGKQPIASGGADTILGILKEHPDSSYISEMAILKIDGNQYKPDTLYDVYGQEVSK